MEEKAYDVKKLVEKLKDEGLDIAEDAAALIVESSLDWVSESAVKSDNKYDDLLAALVPVVKAYLLEEIVDKIDGEDDA